MAFATPSAGWLVLVLLAGCGITPARFDAQFSDAYCALVFSCEDEAALMTFGWADEAECADELVNADTARPDDFDPEAAQACLDAVRALTCEDLVSSPLPVVCSEVE